MSSNSSPTPLITLRPEGLYCAKGDFYIDPWRSVERAVITHAHADHARGGSTTYYVAERGKRLLKHRLGAKIEAQAFPYGEAFQLGEVKLSFHSAGHILGSSQVRVDDGQQVWVASGDYKRTADPSCDPFEVVPCDTFITEATFGFPVYRWKSGAETAKEVYQWWQECKAEAKTAVLFCYALGKAQRLLAELKALTDEPVYLHGATYPLTQLYSEEGIAMLPYQRVSEMPKDHSFAGDLVLAPPSAHRSPWMKRFKAVSTGFASGWMAVRGNRRRRGYERGFVLSDHADWKELIQTIEETQAKQIYVTHGSKETLAQYLREKGYEADILNTLYEGETLTGETEETEVLASDSANSPSEESRAQELKG